MRPMWKRAAIIMIALAGATAQADVMYWQIGAESTGIAGSGFALARARVADRHVDTSLYVWDGDGWRMLGAGEGCADALFDPSEYDASAPECMFVRELVDDSLSLPSASLAVVDLDNANSSMRKQVADMAVSTFSSVAPTPFIFWNAGMIYGY